MANHGRRIAEAVFQTRVVRSSSLSQIISSSSSSSSTVKPNLINNIITRRIHTSSSSVNPISKLPFHEYIFNRNPVSKLPSTKTILSEMFLKKHSTQQLGFHHRKLVSNNGVGVPLGLGNNTRRFMSIKSGGGNSVNKVNLTKSLAGKPMNFVRSTIVSSREAVGLHVEAFWRRNYLSILGAGAFGLCLILWRVMFGIADTFIGFSEGMAKYGFLALSSAMVAFLGLYVRSRFTINPDVVYRIAMRKLNTSAGILEVMGAPLSGTDVRAYVMSSGGLRLKSFKPKIGGKRCFLIFPIRGSERKGLVSVEVKKKNGQYDMKLLAVDVPMSTGPDQRFFLIGDEEEYKVGGGLISELRDPIVKAMAATKEFEELDEKEEEEDEERELEEAERKLEEAERKNREEIEQLEKR
ncbi:hypothetical protein MKX03_015588 [Papaver bracteatum]|nr:hypothetical protein MKX03_015588 [Papaver bracteatum]